MEIILWIFICFLSVYGAYELIYSIALYFAKRKKVNPNFVHYVVAFNHDEEDIEMFVRSKALTMEKEEGLIVLLQDDNPDTIHMLELLMNEYSFLSFMQIDDYNIYLNNLLKNV